MVDAIKVMVPRGPGQGEATNNNVGGMQACKGGGRTHGWDRNGNATTGDASITCRHRRLRRRNTRRRPCRPPAAPSLPGQSARPCRRPWLRAAARVQ